MENEEMPVNPVTDEKVEIAKADLERLQAQLIELEGMREKLLRSAADFENAKKRLAREREDFIKYSQESLLRDLLPILDNFDRALGHQAALETLDTEALRKQLKSLMMGMQMVKKQFLDVLQSQGVRPMETVGKVMDPHIHEAVEHVPGEGKPDEIIGEVQTGYLLQDRLLRAAKVRVRSAQDSSAS